MRASKYVCCAAIMRFDGPAPELINSRLSMLGFVSAVGAELATHETIFTQVRCWFQ